MADHSNDDEQVRQLSQPQPGQPTMDLVAPETRSVFDVIRDWWKRR